MGNALRILTLCGCLTLALAAAPPATAADVPSAIDQYLEVVPDASGDQSPSEFSRSLGGDGGPVTRQQVIAAARANAVRGKARDRRRASEPTTEKAPGMLAAFGSAASGGSAFSGLWAPLLAIVLITALLALASRRLMA